MQKNLGHNKFPTRDNVMEIIVLLDLVGQFADRLATMNAKSVSYQPAVLTGLNIILVVTVGSPHLLLLIMTNHNDISARRKDTDIAQSRCRECTKKG